MYVRNREIGNVNAKASNFCSILFNFQVVKYVMVTCVISYLQRYFWQIVTCYWASYSKK